jgi:circadian clock protein KaiC
MVGALTGAGVTVLMTAEVGISLTDLSFSAGLISFLTDNIILQRYARRIAQSTGGGPDARQRPRQVAAHVRAYGAGLLVGQTLAEYSDIITGAAHRKGESVARRQRRPDQTDPHEKTSLQFAGPSTRL